MTDILITLFGNLSTFIQYAPGTETNITLSDLNASAIVARKRIITVISTEVYAAVSATEGEPRDSLRAAMANLTLANQLIFDTVTRKKNETNIYKYEVEAMKRGYMENYFNAMDSLIQWLSLQTVEANDESSAPALWKKGRYHANLSMCKISNAEQFDALYPIDMSYLFFFRTIPLQRECLSERIGYYYGEITETNKDSLLPLLDLALAKKTIAKALRRFDILEFPPSIRNLFDSSTASRSGADEHAHAIELAAQLDSESDELLISADAVLADSNQTDFSTVTSFNNPDDKIIMLP